MLSMEMKDGEARITQYADAPEAFDLERLAAGVPFLAEALRKEGLSGRCVTLALLAVCGVKAEIGDLTKFSVYE